MTLPTGYSIEQRDLNPIVSIGWFSEQTDLRTVGPYVASESDVWAVSDGEGEVVALALVENGELHRLGVAPDHRRRGVATVLVDRLYEQYGELRAVCRVSLDANDFYEATGWTLDGERHGSPENLYEWRYD